MALRDDPSLAGATLLLAAVALTTGAHATDLCVSCSGPAATYRCEIAGSDPAGPAPAGAQVLCIKEMATRGGHASCSVTRGESGSECAGLLVVVAKPDASPRADAQPAPASAATATAPLQAAPAASVEPPADPAAKAPPATVEALAKDAAAQTKKDWDKTTTAVQNSTEAAGAGLKKAGDSVGSALKKSWDCMVSLFKAC